MTRLMKLKNFSVLALFLTALFGLSVSGGFKPGYEITSPGWKFEVVAGELTAVDNIVLDDRGRIYATSELGDGQGAVVFVDGESRSAIVKNLNRADGLALDSGKLYITEETEDGRIFEFDISTKQLTKLAILQKPEGILRLSDGSLLLTEDTSDGKIVRISPTGENSVVFKGLDRPEGLAINALGEIFVAETGKGRVLKISALGTSSQRINIEIEGITNPDQIAVSPDGSVWITEDVENGRLLKFTNGQLETIVDGLDHPQGIAFASDGMILVTEQKKNRILSFKKI